MGALILLVILVAAIVYGVMSIERGNLDYGIPLVWVGGTAFIVLLTITLVNTIPNAQATKDTIRECEECIKLYHAGELNEAETETLALMIDNTNEHIRVLNRNRGTFFYGLLISGEEITEIPLEDWMRSYIYHDKLAAEISVRHPAKY